MEISRYFAGAAAALLLGALSACGGGGGGGGSGGSAAPGTMQYRGNSLPAVINTSNASTLSAMVLGDSDAAASGSSLSGGVEVRAAQGQIDLGRRLGRSVRNNATPRAGASRASSAPVDQTDACAEGGTIRIFGDLSAFGTGTLTVVYANCAEDGDAWTGQASMQVDGYSVTTGIYTSYTLTFERLSIRGGTNADIAGSLNIVTDIFANTERATQNIVTLYLNGRMTKSENLAYVDVYDDLIHPTSFSESINGRLYQSNHGFVTITTVAPFRFSTMTQPFPGSGEMVLTGSANARIRLTAVTPETLVISLDLNNDNAFETQARLKWTDLSGPVGADLGDNDGDGMHNGWERAFGLNPNGNDAAGDLDGDGFSNLVEYQAWAEPHMANTTLPPPPAGVVTGKVITLANNSDIVYDAVTQQIYAAVRTNPGSVVPVNPVTGALGTPITVGNNPVKLALSDNGQFLYVGLDGQPSVQRISLATQAVDLTIPLGSGTFGDFYVEDMQVPPGASQSVAVSRKYKGVSPRHGGVVIYDGSTPRANTTPGHTGSNVIEFSASASTLYGLNIETSEWGFRRMAVNASGVTVLDVYDSFAPGGPLIVGEDMKFGAGFLFTTSGQMIDPVARVQVPPPGTGNPGRTFTLPGGTGLPAPDTALGRVFYLTITNGGGLPQQWGIWAFDIASRLQTGRADVTGVNGTPSSPIRWGAKGLAFRTSDGQIHMLESPSWIP